MVTDGHIKRGKLRDARRKGTLYRPDPYPETIQGQRRCRPFRNGLRYPCGGFDDFQEGDLIQSVTTEQVAATL